MRCGLLHHEIAARRSDLHGAFRIDYRTDVRHYLPGRIRQHDRRASLSGVLPGIRQRDADYNDRSLMEKEKRKGPPGPPAPPPMRPRDYRPQPRFRAFCGMI